MRVIAFAAVVFLLTVSASWGSAGAVSRPTTLQKPASSHVKTRWRATVAKLPANAATKGQEVYLASISCVSAGNCTAVGSYIAKPRRYEGLLLTEKAGHWRRGVEAVLPANASRSDPGASLNSVSCTSVGNCTAVGGYGDRSLREHALLVTETAGRWAPGVRSVPRTALHSVSCASAGNCTALGSAAAGNDAFFTEKAGHWGGGVDPPLPADAEAGDSPIPSLSCSSDGGCGAVGTYNTQSNREGDSAGEGMLLTKKRGTWRAVKAVMPPDGPGEGTVLTLVSCASAGNCGAVGLYNINIDSEAPAEGVLLTEKAGKWRRGVTAMPPMNANSSYWGNHVDFHGISCPTPGNCGAVGDYYTADNKQHVTLLAEVAGTWRRGVEAALPGAANYSDASAISCASPGNCTVVGSYHGSKGLHGLLLTELAGHWGPGVMAPLSIQSVVSVSCASAGNCGAVDGDASAHGILLDSTRE